jgi:hypothetical protein
MVIQVHSERQKIDYLFKQIKLIDKIEMQAHWSRYLCVLVSGYIENSVKHIIGDYSTNKSSPSIANFVQKKISSVTNLKHNNIFEILDSFDNKWSNKYLSLISDEQIDAINSVVANRHLIAHGKNVGITYSTISKYYTNVVPTVELIYKIVNDEI